ncbi:hypothetical protein TNCV_4353701 [Trichonephila clavipes]|nr:hypothetical protein TNCV_4353701 [Trichonephila clavipes]
MESINRAVACDGTEIYREGLQLIKERSPDPVDDDTDEDDDNNNKENSKDPSNADAFSALQTAVEWYEQQSECCPTQLLLLKRIRGLAAKNRGSTMVTVRFGSFPPQFCGRTPRVGQGPPTSLSLPPSPREDWTAIWSTPCRKGNDAMKAYYCGVKEHGERAASSGVVFVAWFEVSRSLANDNRVYLVGLRFSNCGMRPLGA